MHQDLQTMTKKNREKTAHLKYVSACATLNFTWRINAVRSHLWHGSDAPDLAFVLASGSRMQLRMRILSSGSLASAFEMSTLRPWPRHTSALCCAGVQHDRSAFFTDERFRGSKSVLAICQLLTKQKIKKLRWYPQQPQCFIFTNLSEACCEAKRWKHLSWVSVN